MLRPKRPAPRGVAATRFARAEEVGALTVPAPRRRRDPSPQAPTWPRGSFRLTFSNLAFRGNCATLAVSDDDDAILGARAALGKAIAARDGRAVIGGGPRSEGRPPRGAPSSDPAPHVPDIVHSTVLRWAAEPASRAEAHEAFEAIAADFRPLTVDVTGVVAVAETAPLMHGAEEVWR